MAYLSLHILPGSALSVAPDGKFSELPSPIYHDLDWCGAGVGYNQAGMGSGWLVGRLVV